MNEKIKELANRVAEDMPGVYDLVYESGTKGVEFSEQALEKFAELIVKECQVALSPMLRDMISRGHAYDLIKEHFGIKE